MVCFIAHSGIVILFFFFLKGEKWFSSDFSSFVFQMASLFSLPQTLKWKIRESSFMFSLNTRRRPPGLPHLSYVASFLSGCWTVIG